VPFGKSCGVVGYPFLDKARARMSVHLQTWPPFPSQGQVNSNDLVAQQAIDFVSRTAVPTWAAG
jgi:hypothetical protein